MLRPMDEVPIPRERVEGVLRTLGSTDPLERDAYTLASLRSLVAQSPANAIFDWRESVEGAIEGIIASWHRPSPVLIPRDLPAGSYAFAICCRDGTIRSADRRIEIFPPRR